MLNENKLDYLYKRSFNISADMNTIDKKIQIKIEPKNNACLLFTLNC